MRFTLLGPFTPGDLSPRPRALLALLLLDAGRVVPVDRLLAGIYGDAPPQNAANALQSQISRLRRRLGPEAPAIELLPAGYRIAAEPDDVDALLFERLAAEGRRALAAGDASGAHGLLTRALGLWRGEALAEVSELAEQAVRLTGLRRDAETAQAEASLALGRGDIADLTARLARDPLNETARAQLMRALADEGRQAEALRLYEEARELLADELGADPSAELTAVHTAILRAVPERARVSVPAQLTRFIGREEEHRRLRELLAAHRLVTVTGPGGVGKTRLAVEAAPGAVFADLTAVTGPGELAQALLNALGLRQSALLGGGEAPDPAGRLTAALADEELLLVLDNCEQVIDAVATVTHRLLAGCPRVRVLATSREALGITGEVLFPLSPLDTQDAAVRLFADRARAVRPGFDAENADVRRVCAGLDGLPLAIELAAARLRQLTVAELADRLDDRFRLLSRGERTASPRHRTLRAVVEWSWDLLSAPEQLMLRRLGVFTGGATVDAAAAVAGLDAFEAEDLIADLADKSLVDVRDGRARLLETVRAFGLERLLECGEEAAARRDHAVHHLGLARRLEPALRTTAQLEAMSALDADAANLHAALDWAIEEDIPTAFALLIELTSYWWLRGRRLDGASRARRLLPLITAETDDEAVVVCVANAAVTEQVPPELFARARAVMDHLDAPPRHPFTTVIWALTAGPSDTSFQEEPPNHLFATDAWSRALLALGAGMMHYFGEHGDRGESAFREALAGFRESGDRWGQMQVLDELAKLASGRSDHATALAMFDEALVLSAELGSTSDSVDLTMRKGEELILAGDLPAAVAAFDASLELARRDGSPLGKAVAHSGLARVAALRGDNTGARELYQRVLDGLPGRTFVAELTRITVYCGRAGLDIADGHLDDAEDSLSEAAALAEARWYLPSVAILADARADLLLARGDAEGAAVLRGYASAHGRPSPVPEGFGEAFARGGGLSRDEVGVLLSGGK